MLPKMIGDSIVILFATVFLSFHFAVSLFFYMTFNGFSLDLKNVKRKLFSLYVYSEKANSKHHGSIPLTFVAQSRTTIDSFSADFSNKLPI